MLLSLVAFLLISPERDGGAEAVRSYASASHATPSRYRRPGACCDGRRELLTRTLRASLDLLERRRAPYAAAAGGDHRRCAGAISASPTMQARARARRGHGPAPRSWLPAADRARGWCTASRRCDARSRCGAGGDAARQVAAARAERLPLAAGACSAVARPLRASTRFTPEARMSSGARPPRSRAPGRRAGASCICSTWRRCSMPRSPSLSRAAWCRSPTCSPIRGSRVAAGYLLLLRRDWTAGLLELCARAGHSLAREFGTFFQPFLAPAVTFDAERAAHAFKAVASDGERRFALSRGIASACQLAVQHGYPTFQPLPFHSGRYLASVLDTLFPGQRLRSASSTPTCPRVSLLWRPAARRQGAPRYRSLALGHELVMAELPARLLDESARQPPPGIEAGRHAGRGRRVPRSWRRACEPDCAGRNADERRALRVSVSACPAGGTARTCGR